jgi:multidrug efflux pump subunit AcrA (membrane-fusion protein)
MKLRSFILPALAVAGMAVGTVAVLSAGNPESFSRPLDEPSRTTFESSIAGAGLIEPAGEPIEAAAAVPGIVSAVMVKQGDRVRAGDILFAIDARQAGAELAVAEAQLEAARRELERLRALPRPEDIPVAEAAMQAAEARAQEADALLSLVRSVSDPGALARGEVVRRESAARQAAAQVAEARAALARLRAGAMPQEVAVAEAAVRQAEARVGAMKTELARLEVRAPVDATVLDVNVRPGEFTTSGPGIEAAVVLGDVDTMHVRIDIDENDAWRFRPGSKARATLRGNSAISTDLSFVRVDPYVVPKRSLTGASIERVDTRVLQVIYSYPATALPAYAGQQVDVFVEAPPRFQPPAGEPPATPAPGA